MYKIELTSNYEQLWRYNMIITCGGYDALSEQLYVVGCERIVSEEFNEGIVENLIPPSNFKADEPLILECDEADNIHVIAYLITHTLPEDRMVENTPPFGVKIRIFRHDELVYDQEHMANGWSGATINIRL